MHNPEEKSLLQKVLENCEENGNDLHVRSYSGRGMYGKSCLAFTTNHGLSCFGLIMQAAADILEKDDIQRVGEDLESIKQDSMGMGTVFYFPFIPYFVNSHDDNYDGEEEEDTDE